MMEPCDQCNHDGATAKRQMQYFIDSGNNINRADQMFEAMQSATALCGFTANVLDIRGQKYTKQTQIKNISKIQHVKNKFMMIPRMNTMCGNLVRLVKTQSMKLKDTQLHLFMRKK